MKDEEMEGQIGNFSCKYVLISSAGQEVVGGL